MGFEFAEVGAIVILCYLVGEVAKKTAVDNKWVPAICGITGMILGAISVFLVPNFPATNIVDAMAVGASSGFASTGINQVYKQLKDKKDSV